MIIFILVYNERSETSDGTGVIDGVKFATCRVRCRCSTYYDSGSHSSRSSYHQWRDCCQACTCITSSTFTLLARTTQTLVLSRPASGAAHSRAAPVNHKHIRWIHRWIRYIIPVLICTALLQTFGGRIDSDSTDDGSAQQKARNTDVGGSTRAVDASAASIWMRSSSTCGFFAARRASRASTSHAFSRARHHASAYNASHSSDNSTSES